MHLHTDLTALAAHRAFAVPTRCPYCGDWMVAPVASDSSTATKSAITGNAIRAANCPRTSIPLTAIDGCESGIGVNVRCSLWCLHHAYFMEEET